MCHNDSLLRSTVSFRLDKAFLNVLFNVLFGFLKIVIDKFLQKM